MVRAMFASAFALAAASQPNIVELAQSVPSLSTLVTAVVAGDLAGTLSSPGPFTVFAPTNDAFGALPEGTLDDLLKPESKAELVDILTQHVVLGQVLSTDLPLEALKFLKSVQGNVLAAFKESSGVRIKVNIDHSPSGYFKRVTGADNLASNGVVHIIDGVMLIPPTTTRRTTSVTTAAPKLPNIVELAESVKDLSTLVSAVVAGDLVDTLSSPGPFTVFAPTNDAFGALPTGTLDSLMKPENKGQLVDILTYHVLPKKALADDLDLFQAETTVQGQPLHVQKWGGVVKVGPSLTDLKTVSGADNLASNGVAHIIDGVLIPPSSLAAEAEPTKNIVELAQSVPSLSTLVTAVIAGDLAGTLSSPGPFTVFAPTNDAFGALPAGTLDSLLKPENKDDLVDILTYHVLSDKVLSKDLKKAQRVPTVEGKDVLIFVEPTDLQGGVRVTVSPDGEDIKVVSAADNLATNGVVHIIDGVLIPPAAANPTKNIVELAQSVSSLSTLVAAVVAADLASTLSSPGPFTVFAPTNDAFGALPAGTLDSLLKPENKEDLVDILTYHVLAEEVLSTDLSVFQSVPTVEGKDLVVLTDYAGGVRVGPDARNVFEVSSKDNLATNGVVHVIDGVLLPPSAIVV